MPLGNSVNIPAIGPISSTATGVYSSSYNKFYQPGYANIGISQSSGTTFTVLAEDGTSLSSTNPGYIALQSFANPGQVKRFTVTANQSFTQTGLGNSLFGITTGVNWLNDMPFYLYAVSNANNGENAITFMISRIPHRTVAPAATNIGQSGNTLASTQGSFFALATITAADYAGAPCLCIGSFRMQYTGATTKWTIQTLVNSDGIGQYNDGLNIFTLPAGQNGAQSGKHFTANGGTAPAWTSESGIYTIKRDGTVKYLFANNGAISVSGVGSVILTAVIPLAYGVNSTMEMVTGFFVNASGSAQSGVFALNPLTAIYTLRSLSLYGASANGNSINNVDCTSSAQLTFAFGYIADIG